MRGYARGVHVYARAWRWWEGSGAVGGGGSGGSRGGGGGRGSGGDGGGGGAVGRLPNEAPPRHPGAPPSLPRPAHGAPHVPACTHAPTQAGTHRRVELLAGVERVRHRRHGTEGRHARVEAERHVVVALDGHAEVVHDAKRPGPKVGRGDDGAACPSKLTAARALQPRSKAKEAVVAGGDALSCVALDGPCGLLSVARSLFVLPSTSEEGGGRQRTALGSGRGARRTTDAGAESQAHKSRSTLSRGADFGGGTSLLPDGAVRLALLLVPRARGRGRVPAGRCNHVVDGLAVAAR